jgi:Holliday junction resolvase
MYAPDKAYRVGRATENKARAVLHRAGYVTLRSWMSRSPADLVALKAGEPSLLIQVKKHGYMLPLEREALVAMADQAGATPVLCRMESDGTLTFHAMTGTGIRDLEQLEDIV